MIITGAAGTGKSFIAKALGVQACNEGFRTKVFHLRALLKDLELRDKAGEYAYDKRLRYLSRIPLLIIDEWFACAPSKTELVFLHELIDARYSRTATMICSQMPSENWTSYCPNKALGESIAGRLTSHCYHIQLEGEDMRRTHFQRP